MLEKFILLIVFALPNGNIHVAHEGKPNATVMSAQECEELAVRRKQQGANQTKWVYVICAKVPDDGQANDRPIQEQPKKLNRNDI